MGRVGGGLRFLVGVGACCVVSPGGGAKAPGFRVGAGSDAVWITSAVRRGSVSLETGGDVSERLLREGPGYEASWELRRRPVGQGPLTVALRLEAAEFSGRAVSGFQFRANSGARLRVGEATWTDATGARFAVPAEAHQDTVTFTVPEDRLERAVYPAVLDPYVGPESPVDAPVIVPAAGDQSQVAIASNGSIYLAVWADERNATDHDIYAARLDKTGAFLTAQDAVGIPVAVAPGEQTQPAVASNGQDFFVVWSDGRNSATESTDIYGTAVTAAGVVGSPQGLVISSTAAAQQAPVVASDLASTYLVAWQDARQGNQDIYLSTVSFTGSVGSPIAVTTSGSDETSPTLAWTGARFFVAWAETSVSPSQIYGTGVSTTGAVGTVGGFPLTAAAQAATAPVLAAHAGTDMVLTWLQQVNTFVRNPEAERLNLNGTATGTIAIPAASVASATAAVWDGSEYALAWARYTLPGYILQVAPVSASNVVGTVSTAGNLNVQTPEAPVLAAIPGQGAISVWEDTSNLASAPDVVGSSVAAGAVSANTFVLSQSTNIQIDPSAAASANASALVVWQDLRTAAGYDIWGVLVDADAGVGPSFPVAQQTPSEFSPRVAAGTGVYLATWGVSDAGGTVAVASRISSSGQVLDSPGLLLFDGGLAPTPGTVDFDGQNFLVVYQSCASSCLTETGFRAQRVTPAGQVLDGAGIVIPNTGIAFWPKLAFGGGVHLLVWQGSGVALQSTVVATRISASGTVLDPSTFLIPGQKNQGPAGIAFDGSRFLVAWCDGAFSGEAGLYGAFVSPAAVVSPDGGFFISNCNSTNVAPEVAFDGTNHLVVWTDARDGGGLALYGNWISPSGAILGPDLLVSAGPSTSFSQGELRSAGLATLAGGRIIAAYSNQVVDAGISSPRVLVRAVQRLAPDGQRCAAAAECLSNFCVDGVCCDQACGGSVASDCQACARSAGAPTDGTCAMLAGYTCRAATDLCDQPGICTGASSACPADRPRDAGVVCRPSDGGPCDAPELCDGTHLSCPPDVLEPQGFSCGTPRGPCDKPGVCDGAHVACGPNSIQPSSFVCRPAAGPCDLPETCNGSDISCPADVLAAAGAVCQQAQSTCTSNAVCSGTSASCPAPVSASDGTACAGGACEGGVCVSQKAESHYRLLGCSAGAGAAPWALALLIVMGVRKRRGAVLALLAVVVASAARADSGAPSRPRLLLLGIRATSGVGEDVASSLTEFVQSELISLDLYNVTGQSEIVAVLGVERQRQLLGCSDDSACMAEISGALNARRAIVGDVSKVEGTMLLNLSLLDLRTGQPLSHVGRRVEGGQEALLDVVRPALVELVRADGEVKASSVSLKQDFGGIMAGLRADADLSGQAVAPGLMAELSGRHLGGALTILIGKSVAARLEGRYYPMIFGRLRPYVAAGATVFTPSKDASTTAIGLRAAGGADVRAGPVHVFADLAFEHFFNDQTAVYLPNSFLLGVGVGWLF